MTRNAVRLLALMLTLAAGQSAAMSLASADIAPNTAITARHVYPRCGGANLSPQLSWRGAPKSARSFVITMIDLDVKPDQWSHWIVVDVPATTTALPRGVKSLPGHAQALMSDFGDPSYDGPCPPRGSGVHHYRITVWALPVETAPLRSGLRATDLVARLSKLSIDHASITGTVRG